MPRYSKGQWMTVCNAAFTAKALERLQAMSAKLVYGPKPNLPAEWMLITRYGPLTVTVFDHWIACRFGNVDLAKLHTNCNPCTGKWNFHFDAFTNQIDAENAAVYAMDQIDQIRR